MNNDTEFYLQPIIVNILNDPPYLGRFLLENVATQTEYGTYLPVGFVLLLLGDIRLLFPLLAPYSHRLKLNVSRFTNAIIR